MRRSLTLVVLAALAVPACGGGNNSEPSIGPDGGAAPEPGGGFAADARESDSDPATSSCASSVSAGAPVAANVLFLFDTSASMTEVAGRWDKARGAISRVLDTTPDALRVGIRFFPYPDNACTDSAFATPQVAVAPLAETRKPIQCWLGTQSDCAGITPATSDGGTPMMRALGGAVTYMKALATDGARTIVLVTDGDPHACKDSDTIAGVIEAANRAARGPGPKVTVWVVGAAGGTTANLSRVAEAGEGKRSSTCVGNTSDPAKACSFTAADATLDKDLVDALSAIAGKVRSCTFTLPEGAAADPGKVNVSVAATPISRDPTRMNGWDYDDGGKTITLYGSTCEQVREDGKASVEIVLGCKTKLL